MNRGITMLLVLFVYIIYAAIKHRSIWKKLSLKQIVGVLVTFLIVTGLAGSMLYFWVEFITDELKNEFVILGLEYLSAIIIIIIGVVVFNVYAAKITNGILPVQKKTNTNRNIKK